MNQNTKFPLSLGDDKLQLFAFLIRERPPALDDPSEIIELSYGYSLDSAVNNVNKKYQGVMPGGRAYIKIVGSMPATELIKPILDDVYSMELSDAQAKLAEIEKKTPEVNRRKFLNGLKLSKERYAKEFTKTENAALDKVIGKLERLVMSGSDK